VAEYLTEGCAVRYVADSVEQRPLRGVQIASIAATWALVENDLGLISGYLLGGGMALSCLPGTGYGGNLRMHRCQPLCSQFPRSIQIFVRSTMNEDQPKSTRFRDALKPKVASEVLFQTPALTREAFYADDGALVFHGDATKCLRLLAEAGVKANCIVTSPPFYGQRDYGEDGQIGLELHPADFIERLVSVFTACKKVLVDGGSLWVNLGDTYWSGKGQHRSDEKKQSARRFGLRPQDRTGDGKWCRPKQLLLIPHRFAIAMQEAGWIVRNDNVWVKPNPIPDQVNDRCSMSHEYVFHFVRDRWYYFDRKAVARQSATGSLLPPLDTWTVPPARGNGKHRAAFSEELIAIPVQSTTPPGGIVLDPFSGTGTTVGYAVKLGHRAIGIDIKEEFCELTVASVKGAHLSNQARKKVEETQANVQAGQQLISARR
jgi:site-specific DNA-methyltransferase (cytosine-N4-specific)